MNIPLTVPQARRLVALIKAKSESNPSLMPVLDRLEWELHEHQKEQDAKGPWRNVTATHGSFRAKETLECGHTYILRRSKNWVEDHAKRRRCARCLQEAKPEAQTA